VDAFREGTHAAAITPANFADVFGAAGCGAGEGPAEVETMAEWLATVHTRAGCHSALRFAGAHRVSS
jgi:hypothetical protein